MARLRIFYLVLIFICYQEITNAVNVALSRPADQTESLEFNGYIWEASLAVDGCAPPFPNDDYEGSQCCSCSNAPGENTWTVYLDQAYVLDHVTVQGRSDTDSQLGGFQLYIRQDQVSPQLQVYNNTGVPYINGYFDITIASNMPVTEVTIKRNPGPLTICEVEVFAVDPTSTAAAPTTAIPTAPPATSSIVSRFKPTSQSSTLNYLFDWTSDKAVDGDYRSNNPNIDGSCATTDQAVDNEWRVNLLEQYTIDKIDIYTRSDGQDQISGFEVYGQVDDGFPEFLIYTSNDPIGPSVFNIYVVPATAVKYVIVKRDIFLTLCEVDVFGVLAASPTTTLLPAVTSIRSSTTTAPRVSVALNKPTNQLEDLDYIFLWYSSLAVDGCYDRIDPNNVPCCSTSMGSINNFWNVDLQTTVLIDLVDIYGRADQDDQLPGFQMYIQEFDGAQEELIYDSTGVPYGEGIYSISINPPKLARFVIIRRDGIISLCEVDVFEAVNISPETTTTTSATDVTSTGTTTTTETTTETSIPQTSSTELSTAAQTSVVTTQETTSTQASSSTSLVTSAATSPATTEVPSTAPTSTSTASTSTQPTNIALNQFADQTDTLDFNGYLWEAGLAVDGCKPPFINNDYEGSQCCSGSFAPGQNTWTVYFPTQYVIDRVIVIGRSDQSSQLENFQLYIRQSSISPELLVYNNTGVLYDNGYFDIPVASMLAVAEVSIKRPSGPLLICEVEVYGEALTPETSPASTTTTPESPSTTTPDATTETTTVASTTTEAPVSSTPATTSPTATTTSTATNIALNQFADQTDTLDFNGYLWEAGLAVDGCKPPFLNNDYEGSQCCSGSFAPGQNTWTVYFPTQYVIDRVIVIGRSDQSTQLENFQLYIRQSSVSPEVLVYNNTGVPYDTGYFEIPVTSMLAVTEVSIKRPSGPLLICEVEVYGVEFIDASSSTVDATTPTSTAAATSTMSTIVAGSTTEGTTITSSAATTMLGSSTEFGESTTADQQTSTISVQTLTTTDKQTSTKASETSTAALTSASSPADATSAEQGTTTTVVTTQEATTTHITSGGGVNVALGQMVAQRQPLNYNGFSWTADKAVDGCYDREKPDVSQCCSCSQEVVPGDNFWNLTFYETQILMKINIFGRGDFGSQLDDFLVYINDDTGTPVFDAFGITYTDGFYEIILEPELSTDALIVKRPTGPEYLYITLCEVEAISACDDGFFGEQCDTKCGSCLGGEPCYKITGTCPNKCAAGYQGPQCFTQCTDGNYGNNCQEFCGNCAFGVACDIFTGSCPQGCAPGWKGDFCKTPCEAGEYGADCLNVCGQCVFPTTCNSLTGECESGCAPGWLPQDIMCNTPCIDGFYGAGCAQTCGNCFMGALCDKENGQCPGQCQPGWQGMLCSQACAGGSYGIDCLESCGSCFGGAACDVINGDCPNGLCDPGFTSSNCKQECPDGSYGIGCVMTCGNCFMGATCDKENGECPGQCQPGWQGLLCNQACDEGSYGINCLQTCGSCLGGAACDIFTGDCPSALCDPGFTGSNCKQECPDGTYGLGCALSCGNCFMDAICDKENGQCPGQCQPGWQGSLCNQGCSDGSYGVDCLETCGSCLGGVACDTVTGGCPIGLCDPGFTGINCKQVCDPGTYGPNCQSPCGQCEFGVSCDIVTGACPGNCAAGWQGINCDQAVPSTSTTATTTQGESTTQSTTSSEETTQSSTMSLILSSTKSPISSTTQTPTQGTTSDNSGTSASTPTEMPTDRSTASTTENPTAASTQGPTQTSTDGPTQGSTAGPTQGSTAGPTQGSTVDPTQGSTASSSQRPTADPTQGSTMEPTQGSTVEPTHGSTVDPTQGSSADPTQGSTVVATGSLSTTTDPGNTASTLKISSLPLLLSVSMWVLLRRT